VRIDDTDNVGPPIDLVTLALLPIISGKPNREQWQAAADDFAGLNSAFLLQHPANRQDNPGRSTSLGGQTAPSTVYQTAASQHCPLACHEHDRGLHDVLIAFVNQRGLLPRSLCLGCGGMDHQLTAHGLSDVMSLSVGANTIAVVERAGM
jgi:hypothetical protein